MSKCATFFLSLRAFIVGILLISFAGVESCNNFSDVNDNSYGNKEIDSKKYGDQVGSIGLTQGSASGVPTFHSIGIYWSGSGGSASTVCNVKYRPQGSSTFKDGFPLSFDSRNKGGRPANEYRGSLVGLVPDTMYEIELTAGSATNSLTVKTWSEHFPEGATTTLSSPTTISSGGTATAYKVFTGNISGGTNNINVNAPYIIIRGMTLKDAAEDAILLSANAHHVVIEDNDIFNWGAIGMGSNDQAAVRINGFRYNARNVKQIVVQRNKIHDSRENSHSWGPGSDHPDGPNGINYEEGGGNQVIRYNEVYTTNPAKKFMDGIGGADNFTETGFPGPDSDIYGNIVNNCYDDAIEAEGGGINVRVWSNWMSDTFTGVASATVSVGPMYIFNNISNLSVRLTYGTSPSEINTEDRGEFNKCGSQDASLRGGKTYLFHNTVLEPMESGYGNPRGMSGGIVDNGGPVANVFSRNNIWQTAYDSVGGFTISEGQGGSSTSSYDYDLMNRNPNLNGGVLGSHKIIATPSYTVTPTVASDPNPAGYFLASSSRGVDEGVELPGFNDDFTGSAPDIGAYETGKPALQFGTGALFTGPSGGGGDSAPGGAAGPGGGGSFNGSVYGDTKVVTGCASSSSSSTIFWILLAAATALIVSKKREGES